MSKMKKFLLSFVMVFTLILMSGSSIVSAMSLENESDSDTSENKVNPPTYDVTVKIVPEKGWLVNTTKVNIKVIDNKNTGTFQLKKLEAKIGVNGSWQDITKDGYIEVAENCTVYAQATDSYGTVYSQMRYLDGYDTTPPTFNAAVNNGVLTVEAHDTESGVDCIYINGYKFTPNKKGKLTVRLQKFDSTYANFSIYVTDNCGNESEPYEIPNPYYKADTGEEEDEDSPNPSDSLPSDATANETGESSAQITSVTDENGDDISQEVDGKQFYSVVTKNGQQFYIVIDMTSGEYFEGSSDTAPSGGGRVYFLTNISNNDLLNVTADGEVTLPYNSLAASNSINDDTVSENVQESTEETTEEKTEEKKEKSSNDMFMYIVIGVVMLVVVVVVYRRKKSGKSKTDIIDEDDYGEDEEDEEDGVELTADNMEQFTDEEQEHE